MMQFDPNTIDAGTWSTFCPHRRPQYKVHANRGHALSALSGQGFGILFRRDVDRWIEVWRVEQDHRPEECEVVNCAGKTNAMYGDWKWIDKGTDSPKLVAVCAYHATDKKLK